MQSYNKAIAAVVVPMILAILNVIGVTPDMQVGDAVQVLVMGAITAIAVYLIPNRK